MVKHIAPIVVAVVNVKLKTGTRLEPFIAAAFEAVLQKQIRLAILPLFIFPGLSVKFRG